MSRRCKDAIALAVEQAKHVRRGVKLAAFVVDTNDVIAGLLTRDAASLVARVLDGMIDAALPSWDRLAARPDLWPVTEDRALLEDAATGGRVVTPEAFLRR